MQHFSAASRGAVAQSSFGELAEWILTRLEFR